MVWAAWRRTTVGTSCKFCLMLASRGAVYTSEDVARYGNAGSKYHDHCDCGAELVTDPADADAIRVDPADANRIIQLRVKGRDYVYDLSNYRNLGVADPPKAARAARVVKPSPPDTWQFPDVDEMRGSTEPLTGAGEWAEQLTPGEKTALAKYTGKGSKYSADTVNQVLRDGYELSGDYAEQVANIDSAIRKAEALVKPPKTALYRGIERPRPDGPMSFMWSDEEVFERVADQIERDYPVGSQVSLGRGGFISTSTDVTPALDASVSSDAPGVIFEIAPTTGAPLQVITKYDDEFEVLLDRGAVFQVVAVLRRVEFIDSGLDSRYRTVVQVVRVR